MKLRDYICPFMRLVCLWLAFALIFVLGKAVFIIANQGVYGPYTPTQLWWQVPVHGLRMDLSMAAYLAVVPGLLMVAEPWIGRRAARLATCVWCYIAAFIAVAAIALDAALYSYWNFKLDTTPLFYFLTSPKAAMASVAWWVPVVGLAAVVLVAWGAARCIIRLYDRLSMPDIAVKCARIGVSLWALVLTAALFIPIRGGFTVATMNPSAAYFSTEAPLNHAAVNPLFSFIYSATHSNGYGKQFRYFSSDELQRQLEALNSIPSSEMPIDSLRPTVEYPNVYIFIMESFSTGLMPSMGGEPVALCLDSIASEGTLFTDFYASSFRTDRAIPAILSALPAQPSTSVMKYIDKVERLPSIATVLADSAGYEAWYYYGGDIDFANQKAYLRAGGFDHIVSDRDFPIEQRLSKWGVHDHLLWDRFLDDAVADSAGRHLRVVQTSSSHEPFEVPYTNTRLSDQRAVAFAYADSCLGRAVRRLQQSPAWDNALVVIVPDHWGAYPARTEPAERHHIPLVLTGGALPASAPARVDIPASQSDLAPTIVALLGIDGTNIFPMGHNIFGAPAFAFFSEPDFAAVVTPGDTAVVSTRTGEALGASAADVPKAFLQNLYNYLDSL